MHLTALSEEAPGVKPTVVKGHIGDPKRDPGYWGTSRMVLEAALCLALQEKQLKVCGCVGGACMHTCVRMGCALGQVATVGVLAAGPTLEVPFAVPASVVVAASVVAFALLTVALQRVGARGQQVGARDQRVGARGQQAGLRGQRVGARGQQAGARGQHKVP
eukprot:300864-Chlamydomonas_euryale.AAC.1